jgi:hypothetical protein
MRIQILFEADPGSQNDPNPQNCAIVNKLKNFRQYGIGSNVEGQKQYNQRPFQVEIFIFIGRTSIFLRLKKRRVRTQRAKDHQLLCRNLEQPIWNRVVVHKLGESIPVQF